MEEIKKRSRVSRHFDKLMLFLLITVLGGFSMFCSYMGWEELAKSFGHDNSTVIGCLLGLLTGISIGRSEPK